MEFRVAPERASRKPSKGHCDRRRASWRATRSSRSEPPFARAQSRADFPFRAGSGVTHQEAAVQSLAAASAMIQNAATSSSIGRPSSNWNSG
jgi:hypothetical protein